MGVFLFGTPRSIDQKCGSDQDLFEGNVAASRESAANLKDERMRLSTESRYGSSLMVKTFVAAQKKPRELGAAAG